MSEWGFNPETIAAIGSIAVLATFIGIYLSTKENNKARNLGAVLKISDDFRNRWESKWENLIRVKVPQLNLKEREDSEIKRELLFMLNWLDWMGLLIKKELIDREMLFGSLAIPIKEILKETSTIIKKDITNPEKGEGYWANILYIAKQPEINIDISKEADMVSSRF